MSPRAMLPFSSRGVQSCRFDHRTAWRQRASVLSSLKRLSLQTASGLLAWRIRAPPMRRFVPLFTVLQSVVEDKKVHSGVEDRSCRQLSKQLLAAVAESDEARAADPHCAEMKQTLFLGCHLASAPLDRPRGFVNRVSVDGDQILRCEIVAIAEAEPPLRSLRPGDGFEEG